MTDTKKESEKEPEKEVDTKTQIALLTAQVNALQEENTKLKALAVLTKGNISVPSSLYSEMSRAITLANDHLCRRLGASAKPMTGDWNYLYTAIKNVQAFEK